MQSLWQDVRYGARMMRRHPGFTVAAVLTLALGIGANAAVFSIINVLTLKPLPYHDPSRVAFVLGQHRASGDLRFSLRVADLLDITREVTSFVQVGGYAYVSANLTGGDVPDRVQAYRVTGNMFQLLGASPALGRTFTADEADGRGAGVAVISHGLWQRRFGADPSVVGRRLTLNGTPHSIIGVMPRRFEFPVFNFKGDVWIPWQVGSGGTAVDRAASGSATVVARLKEGVSYAQAQAEVGALMDRLAARHPSTNGALTARVLGIGQLDDEQAGTGLMIIGGAVVLVLLLACANVANLLLARGVSRRRELAVRAAVGAGHWRIARQLFVEALMLAAAGAAAGVVLARLALDALRGALPEMLLATVPNIQELGVDGATLAVTLIVALATSVLFGMVPAWRAARPRTPDALKEGAASGGSRETRRLRTTLVVAEVALATVLVLGAGLLARSYSSLLSVSPGFAAANLLTMATTLPADRYPDPERRRLFYEAVLDRVSHLPGVTGAAFVNVLPFSTYERRTAFVVDGAPVPSREQETSSSLRIATPGYFETMEIPLHAGRRLTRQDTSDSQPVAVVNAALARRYFGSDSPLGRRLRLGDLQSATPWLTIVGVIGNVHHSQLTTAPDAEIYVPLRQATSTTMMMLAVRTQGRPDDLVESVRAEVLAVDPSQPVYHVKPMARLLADSMLPQMTSAMLMGGFSALALLLALVGIYGVISYAVTQQMPEFGLRLALGATPAGLVRLVVGRGAATVLGGIAIGTAAALAASGVLESLLFGVTPVDPLTYAAGIAAFTALGLAACVIPALRASSAEPLAALRRE